MRVKREDIIRLLQEDPTLVEELRAILLTKDLVELPRRTDEQFRQVMQLLRDLLDIVRQLADLLAEIAQQTKENSKQIATLIEQGKRHEEMLAKHNELLARHDELLATLVEQGKRHEELLDKHAELLARHDELLAALVEQGKRHEELLARHDELLAALVEQGKRHEELLAKHAELLAKHEELLAALVEQGKRHEELLAKHAESLARHEELLARLEKLQENQEERLKRLEQWVEWASPRLSKVYGRTLELVYRERPFGFFGEIVRRVRCVSDSEIEEILEKAMNENRITMIEMKEVALADLLLRGIRDGKPTWLVVEISGVIEVDDVSRVIKRKEILSRCVDEQVIPVVAGDFCAKEILDTALQQNVWVVLDGRVYSPETQGEVTNP